MGKTTTENWDLPKNEKARTSIGTPIQDFDPNQYDYDEYYGEDISFHEPEFSHNIYEAEPFTSAEEYLSTDEQDYDETLGTKSTESHPVPLERFGDVFTNKEAKDAERTEPETLLGSGEQTGASQFERERVDLDAEAELISGSERSDEDIRLEAWQRIGEEGTVDANHMQILVSDGNVVLQGIVPSRTEKLITQEIVSAIAGVGLVENQLTVVVD